MATWVMYDNFRLKLYDGGAVDFDADTLKISLHTSTYSPNQATHDFFNDVTNEVTGTNYTAGGDDVSTGAGAAIDGTNIDVDVADASWTQSGSGFSNARYAVLYKDTGVSTTSLLICYSDFGSDQGNTTGDLTLTMNAEGVFRDPRPT